MHLWEIPADAEENVLAEIWNELSAGERGRAGRLQFARDRARYTAAHGALRRVLGRYLSLSPGDLEFSGGDGKPSLAAGGGAPPLRFNMCHSGGAVMIAVASGREVGVDLEEVRELPELGAIARGWFHPAELDLLWSTGARNAEERFYTIWTRKEALVKAQGRGLGLDLRSVDVSSAPSVLDGRWHLMDVEAPAGYVAALAAEGPVDHIIRMGGDEE